MAYFVNLSGEDIENKGNTITNHLHNLLTLECVVVVHI